MTYSYFKLFYGYFKTDGWYPDFDSIGQQEGIFRVAVSHVEDEVKKIYDKTAPDSWDELSEFDRDKLLNGLSNYFGNWYDLDEAFVSGYWALWEQEYKDVKTCKDLKDSLEDEKMLEFLPVVTDFISYHDVREAISSMRQMADNGYFNIIGMCTLKADTMKEEMLRNMETVMRFIERYQGA